MRIPCLIALCAAGALAQIQFGGDSSSSSSPASSAPDASVPAAATSDDSDVNTRFFGLFKPKPKPRPVWRPRPTQRPTQHYQANSCGRRRRQAEENSNTRFFLKPKPKPVWTGCTCGRRRRRQAGEEGAEAGEGSSNTRFFGLFKPKPKPRPVVKPHCGSCCYSSSSSSSSSSQYQQNSNHHPKPSPQQSHHTSSSSCDPLKRSGCSSSKPQPTCKCSQNNLVFRDEYGKTHGNCQSTDDTGKTWCYTTGWDASCTDLVKSQRFSGNPWSYQACASAAPVSSSFIRKG